MGEYSMVSYASVTFTLKTAWDGSVIVPYGARVRRIRETYANDGRRAFYCEVYRGEDGVWTWGHTTTDPRSPYRVGDLVMVECRLGNVKIRRPALITSKPVACESPVTGEAFWEHEVLIESWGRATLNDIKSLSQIHPYE